MFSSLDITKWWSLIGLGHPLSNSCPSTSSFWSFSLTLSRDSVTGPPIVLFFLFPYSVF